MSRATLATFTLVFAFFARPLPATAQGAPPAPSGDEPRAEAATPDAKAAAETLFTKGKELLDAGKCDEAYPLLKESLRLDFGLGTLLWLSHCQEELGMTASAWAGFKEAEQLAKRKGQADREEAAKKRATALEPKLARLKLLVHEANEGIGLVVKRNGVIVGEPTWGQLLPVDPGEQKVEATAPGYKPWSGTVEIAPGPSDAEATVPALEKLPEEPTVAKTPAVDARAMRISGIAIGAAGIAGLIIGTGFGIDAIVKYNDAVDTCVDGDPDRCTPTGVRLQQDASSSALVSTVSFTIGAAALAAGTLVFFLAPKSDPPPEVVASIGPDGFFFSFGGAL